MSATPETAVESVSALPRLSRRGALFGAAALLSPFVPRISAAAAPAPVPVPVPTPATATGLVRLDSNENPYGPSPAARRAILASVADAPRYADQAVIDLTAALAARDGFDASQVVVGTGSGELLKIVGLLAAEGAAGGELVAAHPTFEELPGFAAKMGVATRWVPPDADHRHDLAAMHAAIGPNTQLVYVCNPNNPTGTAVGRVELEQFIRAVPAPVLVLVDEAYMDLADGDSVGSVVPLVRHCPNLVVLRTFSKIHGLAGLRIGYAVAAPELAGRIGAKLVSFPNSVGLHAALASLRDHEFLATTRSALIADRRRVEAEIDRLGRPRAKSHGNFVFFDTGMPHKAFFERMLAQHIKIGRHFERYDTWARVTIGTRPEVDRLLAALPAALRA
jgi:histidinol-phosphate aminotransferase